MSARVGPVRPEDQGLAPPRRPRSLADGRAMVRALLRGGPVAAGVPCETPTQHLDASAPVALPPQAIQSLTAKALRQRQSSADLEAAVEAAREAEAARAEQVEATGRLRAELRLVETESREAAARAEEAQRAADMAAASQAALEMLAAERAEAAQQGVGEAFDDAFDPVLDMGAEILGADRPTAAYSYDVALFVFDHGGDRAGYSASVFKAVAKYLENADGLCVFCDGDLAEAAGGAQRAADALRRLRGYAGRIEAADEASPLADLNAARGPVHGYVAAMWTDRPETIPMLHLKLSQRIAPGYLGCFLMDGARFRRLMTVGAGELSLIERYYFEDGAPGSFGP